MLLTKTSLVLLTALLAAAAAGSALHAAQASFPAGATIDRTLACTVLPAGTGAIAGQALPREGTTYATAAQLTLSTGNGAGYNAGEPLLAVYRGGVARAIPQVVLDTELCRQARARVPLSSRGLDPWPTPSLGGHATCLAARQVFVHLHVLMRSPPKWTSQPPNQIARGVPLSAEIAIRSVKQKPLIYMTLKGDVARFYSAKNCF